MAIEGVLADCHKQSLAINKFIFHAIDTEEASEPMYLDQISLSASQKQFFNDRIIEASVGGQYLFTDRERSEVAVESQRIIDDPETHFVDSSKSLAHDFMRLHHGATSPGIFIVAKITITNNSEQVPLVALIKMDFQRVYAVSINKSNQANLEEIIRALAESKSALQKVAIIDLTDTFAWDVLAFDQKAPKGIADYFRRFLSVDDRQDPASLTRTAFKATQDWARQNTEITPDDENWSTYKERAYQYLRSHDTFTLNSFLDMVIRDDDHDRKQECIDSLQEHLANEGISDHTFSPNLARISNSERKNTILTETNVTITWEGPSTARGIEIINPEDNDEGDEYKIIIRTPTIW